MTGVRLSELDASFLAVETPTAHMHVGWVSVFSMRDGGGLPRFAELRDHVDSRLERAPRYRQKLAPVPLGLRPPEWIDDPGFSVDRHFYQAPGPLTELVDEVMSTPLRRDRPLWEMWVCEDEAARQFAIVGKAHHCMVDGLAAIELTSLLLDPAPDTRADGRRARWRAGPEPGRARLLARGARDLAGQQVGLLKWSLRGAASPAKAAPKAAANAVRVARALAHSLSAAPASPLNRELSPLRGLAWAQRPLAELQTIKRAYGTTVNDVMLAAVAGGVRAHMLRQGEQPAELKAMVPVSVRAPEHELGNRISFVFVALPCDEPDPIRRLYRVNLAMSERKRHGEPEGADLAMKAAAHTPGVVQHAISKVLASPRTFNLVVSNIPGPAEQLYMLGCPLQAAYPVVPLSDRHAVSVGMTSIRGKACFGVYADPVSVPDVESMAQDIDRSLTEMLSSVPAEPR